MAGRVSLICHRSVPSRLTYLLTCDTPRLHGEQIITLLLLVQSVLEFMAGAWTDESQYAQSSQPPDIPCKLYDGRAFLSLGETSTSRPDDGLDGKVIGYGDERRQFD